MLDDKPGKTDITFLKKDFAISNCQTSNEMTLLKLETKLGEKDNILEENC